MSGNIEFHMGDSADVESGNVPDDTWVTSSKVFTWLLALVVERHEDDKEMLKDLDAANWINYLSFDILIRHDDEQLARRLCAAFHAVADEIAEGKIPPPRYFNLPVGDVSLQAPFTRLRDMLEAQQKRMGWPCSPRGNSLSQ